MRISDEDQSGVRRSRDLLSLGIACKPIGVVVMPLCRYVQKADSSSRDPVQAPAVARRVVTDSSKLDDGVASVVGDIQLKMAAENLGGLPAENDSAGHVGDDVTGVRVLHGVNYTANVTDGGALNATERTWGDDGLKINELQLIKVVVLVVVISILLLSTCKLVMKTFSRFAGTVGRKEDPF